MKELLKKVVISFLLLLISIKLSAQFGLKGILKDAGSGIPIYNAHIINRNNQSYSITDSSGRFKITVKTGDNLVLSSVGYKTSHYTIDNNNMIFKDSIILYMTLDTVQLEPVDIYSQNWKGFKEACKDYNEYYNPDKINLDGVIQHKGPFIPPKPTIWNPAEFLYSIFGKEARRERRLNRYRSIINSPKTSNESNIE